MDLILLRRLKWTDKKYCKELLATIRSWFEITPLMFKFQPVRLRAAWA
jgi:hypothetical protein